MKKKGIDELRDALRRMGQATRPALSAATGLSKVRVNQMVAELVDAGELQELRLQDSTGGRPALLYSFAPQYASHVLIVIEHEGSIYRVRVECLDALGGLRESQERHYAQLETSSFVALLEDYEGRGLQSVLLCAPSHLRFSGLRSLVEERCHCPLHIFDISTALADRQEGSLSLSFVQGQVARAHFYQDGKLHRTGDLNLLPMPSTWQKLDYGDHTLLEEMVARLVLYLTCALSPSRVILQSDFWNERLMKRLRFNIASKLRDSVPLALEFQARQGESADEAMRHLVTR